MGRPHRFSNSASNYIGSDWGPRDWPDSDDSASESTDSEATQAEDAWLQVKESGSVNDLETFIENFKATKSATVWIEKARTRLNELRSSNSPDISARAADPVSVQDNEGVPSDVAFRPFRVFVAVSYLKDCDGGDSAGCFNAAQLYAKGEGVEQDHQRAAELYSKACDGAEMAGCVWLGAMYDVGDGILQDTFRALQLFEIACDNGDMAGCSGLAMMYRLGRGTPEDLDKAIRLYRTACEGGFEHACDEAQQLE